MPDKIDLAAPAAGSDTAGGASIKLENPTPGPVTTSLTGTGDAKPAEPAKAADTETFFSRTKEEEKDTTMMKSILTKSGPPKIRPILGSAPTLQKSIEAEKVTGQKKSLRAAMTFFVISLLIAGGSVFYFYSQLSPTFDLFGPNPTAQLTELNKNLRSSQAVINKHRYLAAQLDLNSFSFISDDFMDKTNQLTLKQLTPAQITAISNSVTDAANELPARLLAIKDNLTPSIVIETYQTEAEADMTPESIQKDAETALRDSLLEERKQLTQSSELSDNYDQDLRLIDNTLKLVGNSRLLNTIKGANPEKFREDLLAYADSLDVPLRESLQKTMGDILATTKSDISTIGAVKAKRTSWLWIIDKIEEVTIGVDPNFNSGLFEVTGLEVKYNGYTLDANSGAVVLSGQTRTIDAKNFSLITELIDAFEQSPYFKNVEMRSFSKSGDEISGFTASFNLNLTIEKEGISPRNQILSIISRPVALNTSGVKRTK